MTNNPTTPKNPTELAEITPAEFNLLVSLFTTGQLEEMERTAIELLERSPHSGIAWKALGTALLVQRKDALLALKKASELLPNDIEVHCNMGNALRELKKLDEAEVCCRRALENRPDLAELHSNLGNVLMDLGQLDSAVECYCRALTINPNLAETHNNLGYAWHILRKEDSAIVEYRTALSLRPNYFDAHNNLGLSLRLCGQFENAIDSYRKALEIKPDYVPAINNLGDIQRAMGQLDKAVVYFRQALNLDPENTEVQSNLQLTLLYMKNQPKESLKFEADNFGSMVSKIATPYTAWSNDRTPSKRLRIGFLSGDLHGHSVGFFLDGIFAALTSNRSCNLELIAYSTSTFSDALTERLKACCGEWNSTVGLSDQKLAERIFADQIDILIDLAGHTGYNRLPVFAWKPAPVQATWLGYLATTGVRAIDYIIGDPWVLPFAEQVYFTEKICHIPDSYVCFTPPEIDVPVSALPAQNNGYVTFGCFNNLSKVNDSVIALWSRILTAVPNSRLYLKTKQLSDPVVKLQVTAQFESHRIKPGRLILEGTKPNRTEHLASYGRVDIALDPFPYPGITTSVEALWMGVPMITLAAQGFLSRQGIGILTNAGLPDWISTDENDYVLKAIHHASDLTRLTALRARLRQQVMKSPLFDAPRFALNFETTLRGMWTEWSKLQLSKESVSLH